MNTMRLGRAAFAIAVSCGTTALVAACLFPSLDDLEGGSVVDSSTPASDGPTTSGDGGSEGSPTDGPGGDTFIPLSELDCDAAAAVFRLDEGKGLTVDDCAKRYTGTISVLDGGGGYGWTDAGLTLSGSRILVADPDGDSNKRLLVGMDKGSGRPATFTAMAWVALASPATRNINAFVGRSIGSHNAWLFAIEVAESYRASLFIRLPAVSPDLRGNQYDADTGWHHAAVAFRNDARFYFYFDGMPTGSADYPAGSWAPEDSPVEIGAASSNGEAYLRGSLRDVRLYETDLTAEQIKAIAAEQ